MKSVWEWYVSLPEGTLGISTESTALFPSTKIVANVPDKSYSTECQDEDNSEQNSWPARDGHAAQVGLTLIRLCSISENLVLNASQFSHKGIIWCPARKNGCLVWEESERKGLEALLFSTQTFTKPCFIFRTMSHLILLCAYLPASAGMGRAVTQLHRLRELMWVYCFLAIRPLPSHRGSEGIQIQGPRLLSLSLFADDTPTCAQTGTQELIHFKVVSFFHLLSSS